MEEMPDDNWVDHPQHYGGDTAYETIKVLEAWDPVGTYYFCWGNAIKYQSRLGKKDDEAQDLAKAAWYASKAAEIFARLPYSLGEARKAIAHLLEDFGLTSVKDLIETVERLRSDASMYESQVDDMRERREQIANEAFAAMREVEVLKVGNRDTRIALENLRNQIAGHVRQAKNYEQRHLNDQEELARLREMVRGDYWIWQDEIRDNQIDTLTVPILILPEQMQKLIAQIPMAGLVQERPNPHLNT